MTTKFYTWKQPLVLEISGKDSTRYLHGRCTQNIKDIEPGNWANTAITDATSRVQGLLTIIRIDTEKFLAVSRSGEPALIQEALTKFIVADRVNVTVIDAKVVYIENNDEIYERLNKGSESTIYQEEDFIAYKLLSGYEQICFDSEKAHPQGEELSEQEITCKRVNHHMPFFGEEITEKTLFMDTRLKSYVGFGAGCYIGQEVIEKVDARGKAPNQLLGIKLQGEVSLQSDSPVEIRASGAWEKKGKVLNSACDNSETLAFIFTKNIDIEEIKVNGLSATMV